MTDVTVPPVLYRELVRRDIMRRINHERAILRRFDRNTPNYYRVWQAINRLETEMAKINYEIRGASRK